jgi:DNA repair photolyase
MSVIYEPKGKAREYSPQALNLYLQCSHKCLYCYAPSALQKTRESYFNKPEPRKGVIESLKKEVKKAVKEQILLSFIGDVYSDTADDNKTTREALEILLEAKLPVAILTKGGLRCLKDVDLFKQFGEHIQIGATLTFSKDKDSLEYEKGAVLPDERIEMLKQLKENRIRTFASFEPVIIPEQSLELMQRGLKHIDVYKVGKINNFRGLDKTIDWTKFLSSTVNLLRENEKPFYIKYDLRMAAPSVKLYGNEVLPDEHCVR